MIPVSLAMIFWGAVIVALGVALMLVILFKLALIASEMDMPEALFPLFVLNFPVILFVAILAFALDAGWGICSARCRMQRKFDQQSCGTDENARDGDADINQSFPKVFARRAMIEISIFFFLAGFAVGQVFGILMGIRQCLLP